MELSSAIFILYVLCFIALFTLLALCAPPLVISIISIVLLVLGFLSLVPVLSEYTLGILFYVRLLKRSGKSKTNNGLTDDDLESAKCETKGKLACIIAAYLPNEKDIIMETLEKFFKAVESSHARDRIRVILAYNTPNDMPALEKELAELEISKDGLFQLVKVHKSTSKAENLNFVLKSHVSDVDLVGIFDADHWPGQGAFDRVLRRFQSDDNGKQIDCIQGRCIVRNYNDNCLTRFVLAPEFDVIYCFMHSGRYYMSGFGIFGGSNGYWRTEVVKSLCFNEKLLTEDIDCSYRAISSGFHIVHDPLVESEELAPTSVSDLLRQRKRWSRGWFQISFQKAWFEMIASDISTRSKLGLLQLFVWREFMVQTNLPKIMFSLCLLIVNSLAVIKYTPPLEVQICDYVISGSVILFSAMTCLSLFLLVKRNFFHSLVFSIIFPFYTLFLSGLAIHSSFSILFNGGDLAWQVTPRTPTKKESDEETH